MRVEHLSLADFRNYETAELPLGAGPQLIVGRNGQGKTNLVEAISYFDSLSSHRVSNDQPLIRAGCDTAVVRMKVAVRNRTVVLELELNRGRAKRAQVNGTAVKPKDLMQWFTCVVFAPEDLMIARGEPSHRRGFLDGAIVTRNPAMEPVYRDFERVLKQRNAVLKSARQTGDLSSAKSLLPTWNEQLIGFGSRIVAERRALLTLLAPRVAAAYQLLVENDHRPSLGLTETFSDTGWEPQPVAMDATEVNVSRETFVEQFRSALESVAASEFERGVTLVGPHRDDMILSLNGLPVKGYASHGETWSFVLALRLAFADLLRDESFTGDPVVILDDVFAELDARRRQQLMTAVGDYEQIIVTAAVLEDIPDRVEWNVARVRDGALLGHSEKRPVRNGDDGFPGEVSTGIADVTDEDRSE